MTVWRWTILEIEQYSLSHIDCVGVGLSYQWTTVHFLTVTVERWTLFQMDSYLLPLSHSGEMDALANGQLFTASQWHCEDGRSNKWTTIHCLAVTMWEMDTLTNGQLFTSSHWQCGDGGFYKWNTIHCFCSNSTNMAALTSGPLLTASRWHWIWTLLGMYHYSLPHSDSVGDGHSYAWTTIHFLAVTVRRWTL